MEMTKSIIYSLIFHSVMIVLTVLSLPFMIREPIDLPPIVSVELIQISDKTNIPFAPKVRKIIEETKKKEEERVVSEQAPPAVEICPPGQLPQEVAPAPLLWPAGHPIQMLLSAPGTVLYFPAAHPVHMDAPLEL